MATIASLSVAVDAKTGAYHRAMRRVDQIAARTKRKFTTLEASTLSLGKAFMVLAGATGAAFAAKKIFDLGAAVEETANKFDVVMGQSAAAARQRLSDLTDTIPLLQSEMEGMAAGIQDLLVPLGLVREDAADMSVDMVKLAGDLASFNNVAADVPLNAIKSALAGMSRPLRQFGVVADDARLETIAFEEGLIGLGEELDSAARAQAVMIAVQRDSTDAMGDAARTADSAANTMRFFMRDARQVAETFAVALVPAIKEFVGEGSGALQFLETFAAEMQNQAPVIAAWARFAIEAGKFVAKSFVAPIRLAFEYGQIIGNLLNLMAAMATRDFVAGAFAVEAIKDAMADADAVVDGLTASFDDMRIASGEAFGTMPEQIVTATAAAREFVGALTGGGGEGGRGGSGGGGGGAGLIPSLREAAGVLNMAFATSTQHVVELDNKIQNTITSTSALAAEAENFRSGFASAAARAGLSFSRFADLVIAELKRIALVKAALKIFDFLGIGDVFSSIGKAFGGKKQHGGFIRGGQFAIAGEAGAEIVTGPANVVSARETNQRLSRSNRGDIVASFERVLDRLGPPPGPMHPEALAQSDYHRRLISLSLKDFIDRGGDFN